MRPILIAQSKDLMRLYSIYSGFNEVHAPLSEINFVTQKGGKQQIKKTFGIRLSKHLRE